MKLTLLESMVYEARRTDVPYKEVRNKKTNVLEQVIVELGGHESAAFSRMANRWERLDKAMKLMEEKRNELHDRLRDATIDMFAPEDEVVTRVVDTASWFLKIAKKAAVKQKDPVTDWEKVAKGMMELLSEELQPKVEELVKLYTSIPEGPKGPPKKPSLLKTKKLQEGFGEAVKALGDKVYAAWSKVAKAVAGWALSYDKKFAKLKALAA